MPRLIYSLVRGEERMYLNAMIQEEAMAEAYNQMGYGSLDADPLEILAKLTREGFHIEREADYPYRCFREADGSEDLHMISILSQKTQYTVAELNKLMEDGMTLEQIFEEEKKNPLVGRTW